MWAARDPRGPFLARVRYWAASFRALPTMP